MLTKKGMMLRFLKGSKHLFLFSILASALSSGVDMIVPQIIRVVVDYCLAGDASKLPVWMTELLESAGGRSWWLDHLYLIAIFLIGVAVLSALFQYICTVLNTRGAEGMTKRARDLLFSHLIHLPFAWHMENQTGDILQRCTSDVDSIKDFVSEQLVQVVRIAILIGFSAFCMASMSPLLSLVVFASIPIIIGYSWFFYGRIGHYFLECDENEGVLSTITQENLTGVRVVRAFGREQYERERFRRQNEVYTDAWMALCRLLAGFWASGDMIMGIQLLLLVVFGSILCVKGYLTAGELVAFISYNRKLIWPVRRLGRMISEMSKAGVSMERLLYILNSPVEDPVEDGLTPELKGDIELEHVTFSYEEGKEILKDISMTIAGGSTVGILGLTGSGKSTLVHLLGRLYDPDQGEIRIGGVPVKDMKLSWLRSQVGMVLQEPFLFSRTIGENISMTKSATMEQIKKAASLAALDESIEDFAKGYDTIVGERGVTLSGGQKQRAAMARMLVQESPVMIFDDSLSAVDAGTDEKIRNNLKQVMGHATVILISHRISTLKAADRIYVLRKGQLEDAGTHQELIHRPGLYQSVYKIQMEPEDIDEKGGDDHEQ